MNAYTGREQTAYYVKVLKEDVPLALDMLADILQHSIFDPDELERERGVILQEIGQAEDTPDDIIFDHFQETAYPDQALGRPVLGSAEIIETLPREALVDFQQRHYGAAQHGGGRRRPGRSRPAGRAASKRVSPSCRATADGAYEPARYAGGEFRDDEDLEQVHLVLGFPGVSLDDPDYYAAAVLSTLLGGGMSSRLFQEVREKRGLAYSISSFSARTSTAASSASTPAPARTRSPS